MAYVDDYLRILGIDPSSVAETPVQSVYPENSIHPAIDKEPILYNNYVPPAQQHLLLMQQLAGAQLPANQIAVDNGDPYYATNRYVDDFDDPTAREVEWQDQYLHKKPEPEYTTTVHMADNDVPIFTDTYKDGTVKTSDGLPLGTVARMPLDIAKQIAKHNVLKDKAPTKNPSENTNTNDTSDKVDLTKPYHYSGPTADDAIIKKAPPVTGVENQPFYAPNWFNTHPSTLADMLGLAKVTTGSATLDGINNAMAGLDTIAATSAMGSEYVNNRIDQLVKSGVDMETARAQALAEFLQGTGSTRAANTLGLDTYMKAADAAGDKGLGFAVSAGGGYNAGPGYRGYTPNGVRAYQDNGDGTISIVTPNQTYTMTADNAPEALSTGLNGATKGAQKVVTNMINAEKQRAANAQAEQKAQLDAMNDLIKLQQERIKLATETRKEEEKAAKEAAKSGNKSATTINASDFR